MKHEVSIAQQIQTSLLQAAPYRQRWLLSIEFVRGNQEPGLAVSNITNGGQNITNWVWNSENIQIDKISPIRNNIAARLTTAYPSMTVLPASDSLDDEMKMKSAQLALRYFWNENKVKRKLAEGVEWLTDTGNYGMHETFDELIGDVNLEIITPFDLLYEPYVRKAEDSEWVAIRRFTTKAALKLRFPEEAEEIENAAMTSLGMDSFTQLGPESRPDNRVEVWEVYTIDGRHLMLLGYHVLWEGRTQTHRAPVQHVRYTSISGYLQGVGLVEKCLSTQVMRNRFMTQIMKNAYQMANPKILIPAESDVEADAFAIDTGEKIVYQGGHAPSSWNPAPLPMYLVNLPHTLDADMNDAASMPAVSQGKTVGASSGTMVDSLTANALSPLQLVQEHIEEAVQDMAVCVLELMKANYSEKKMVRMLDTDGSFVWQELSHTSFCENPQVFLEAGSLFRSEANDRDAKTLNYLKAGMLSPEQAKANLSTHAVSLDGVSKMKAIRHAKDLLSAVVVFNRPLEVSPTDDLDDLNTLKEVFKDFVHSPAFYKLPLPKQDMVDQCWQQIGQMIAQKQAEAANPGGQPAPTGPGGPGAPPPMPGQTPRPGGLVGPGIPTADPATVQGQMQASAPFVAPMIAAKLNKPPGGAQ